MTLLGSNQGVNRKTGCVIKTSVKSPPTAIAANALGYVAARNAFIGRNAIQLAINNITVKTPNVINAFCESKMKVRKYPINMSCNSIRDNAYNADPAFTAQRNRITTTTDTGTKANARFNNGIASTPAFIIALPSSHSMNTDTNTHRQSFAYL